jgi:hypothetical protein
VKAGDYVARYKNKSCIDHLDYNPEPFGLIVCKSETGGIHNFWDVLMSCGGVGSFSETYLNVINENG